MNKCQADFQALFKIVANFLLQKLVIVLNFPLKYMKVYVMFSLKRKRQLFEIKLSTEKSEFFA